MGGNYFRRAKSFSEGSINLYNDIDIFFTFGEICVNPIKFLKDMGSNIIKTFAVGHL